jgi:hypothetical protein
MLTGIDRSIRFRALIALDSRSESEIFRGIKSILRLYANGGFRIPCDQEIRNMMEGVSEDFNIETNHATAVLVVTSKRPLKLRFDCCCSFNIVCTSSVLR